ncbi:MAG: hypothetical protein K2F99_09365, partial [Muribaculaceae bacterium]|nr:hypothetical protein [Muribaculaceae bacterium]
CHCRQERPQRTRSSRNGRRNARNDVISNISLITHKKSCDPSQDFFCSKATQKQLGGIDESESEPPTKQAGGHEHRDARTSPEA